MESRKRLLDSCNDFKLEELCRSHKKLVPAVRDFPPGCGINNEAEREPPKINSNVGRMVDSSPPVVEANIFISSKTQESGRNRPCFVSRPAGKVKLYVPPCTKGGGYIQKPKVTTTIRMRRKNLGNVDANGSKMSWNLEDKLTSSKPDKNSKLKSFEPNDTGRNKAYVASRSTGGEDKMTDCKPDENGKLKSFEPNESGINKAYVASRSIDGEDKLTNSKHDENGKLKSFEPNESGRNKAYVASRSIDGDDKLTNSKPDEYGKLKSFEPNEPCRNKACFTSRSTYGNDKLMNFKHVVLVENSKLRSFASMEPGRRKAYIAPKSTGKVKYYDPTCEAQKLEVTPVSEKDQIRREKIKEAVSIFEEVHELLLEENKKIDPSRAPFEAAKIVKQKMKWKDPEKTSGPVCGIQIGDKFRYRSQLMMFGLHCQPHSGIDYVKIGEKNLAISIVDSRRYSNESGSSDTLTYFGQGGCTGYGPKLPPEYQKDQELVRGNMAMKNNMDKKTPVRVIKKIHGHGKEVFVYDGLYTVDRYAKETSAEGKIVYKFYLNRVPGQPLLQKMLKW